MEEGVIMSLKVFWHLDITELKAIFITRLIGRNLWDKILFSVIYYS